MKVSLILTTYNSKENLRGTLDSIFEQTYKDIEVIIQDGKSTDGTLEIIIEYAYAHKNIIWNSEKDSGIYDAMNKGLKNATGDVIAFFNDRFYNKDTIKIIIEEMKDLNGVYAGIHGDLVYKDEAKIIREWKMGNGTIEKGWMPAHPTLFLNKDVYEKYGLYNTKFKCASDYEFMVRILKDNKIRLKYIPQTLVVMYYGGTSTKGFKAYITSFKESYVALKNNYVRYPVLIMIRRTIRLLKQFKI